MCYNAPMALLPATSERFCRRCGYNLHGLPENRCPECGKAFDPNNPKTYFQHAASLSRRWWAKRIIVVLVTLLILSSTAGLTLWYGWHREQAAVQMMGRYDRDFTVAIIGPRWLQWLLGNRGSFLLQRVDAVYFTNSPVTDAELASLKGLSHLLFLDLCGNSKLTDADLMNLQDLKQLQTVILVGTQVMDAGVAELQNALPNCAILHLSVPPPYRH